MDAHDSPSNPNEKRSETRDTAKEYYSVQFTTESLASIYQFKLWNVSPKGLGIVVKDGSKVLKHIKVGDVIEMTYFFSDGQGAHKDLKTQIKHITKNENGRFEGHYLVGLLIL